MLPVNQELPIESQDRLYLERLPIAIREMKECVSIDRERMAGIPTLKGTRMTLAQLLGQLADGMSVTTVAEEFEIDQHLIESFLNSLSTYFNRPLDT